MFIIKNRNEAGTNIQTFTYDFKDYTYIREDHYITIGASYILSPFIWSFEEFGNINNKHVNPLHAKMNRLNISVLSIGNGWNDCNNSTFVCDVEHPNISITVKIESLDDEDIVISNNSNKDPFDLIDLETECISNNVQNFSISTKGKKFHEIHIKSYMYQYLGRVQQN